MSILGTALPDLGGEVLPPELLAGGRFDPVVAAATAELSAALAAGGTVGSVLVRLAGENVRLRGELASVLEYAAGLERALHTAVCP